MTSRSISITRVLSILMIIISLIIVIAVPTGYFLIVHRYMAGSIDAGLELTARDVEALVASNPKKWHFEEIRLQEILGRHINHDNPEAQTIRDLQGHTVAQVKEPLSSPVLTRSQSIYDSGIRVGSIEIERSITSLAVRTAIVGVCSALMGIVLFLVFWLIPLQAVREASRSVEENEKRLKLAVASGYFGVSDWDVEQNAMVWNDRMYEIYGVSRDSVKVVLEAWRKGIHSEDRDRLLEDIRTEALGGKNYRTDFRIVRPDGLVRHILYNAIATRNGDGKLSRIVGLYSDITEHKRSIDALEESEERYRTVVEHSRDGIAIIAEGICKYVNQRFLDMFGFHSAEEVLGAAHSVTVHPDDLERVAGINKMRQAGDIVPSTYEFKGLKKDGSTIFVDVSATRIMYQGNYDNLVFLRDITDQKQAEDELRKSEQTLQAERDKLQIISDNAPFGMALIDKEGHFTYINPKFTELFGFDLIDVPDGRTWFRKAYPNTEYRHTAISTWTENLKDAGPGEQKSGVFTVTCKDGAQKIMHFVSSVLVSGDYLTACEDITGLKHLESQLLQAQKMEAIGTLAGGIAHDFNNILTAIMGYGSLLQMAMDKTNPLKSYVDPILSAAQKAADLTQSLLAFSRQKPITLVPLAINNTIKGTKKLLKRLLTEDVELRTSFTGDDAIVMADKTQMDQILFNLVTNARDAMPRGGTLTIETDIVEIDREFMGAHGFGEPGKYVLIKVSDTGMGMDEVTREHIFDPFFTTKEVGKGTGLGLATVYGIVKQHHGYIAVDSAPYQGTIFRIYLPAVRAIVHQEEQATVSVKRGKETILIAEDNEGVRHFIRDLLKQYGYKTIEAMDGEDAIDRFTQHRDIDLIIVDSVMPKKNGREVYEEIRKVRPHMKALFTSGYTKDVFLDKGIEDNKDFDFIAKPLSPATLLQKVREVLDR